MTDSTIKTGLFIFSLLCFFNQISFGQKEDSILIEKARLMHSIHGYDTLSEAYSEFSSLFIKELKKPYSFSKKFDSLVDVSFLYAQDSTFRIMTWQGRLSDNKFTYSGCIQTKDTLFVLKNREINFNSSSFNTIELNNSNWYGCLYYSIKSFIYKKQTSYVIFGFQQPGLASKRKVMDVLSFKNGLPVFGLPVFCDKKSEVCLSRVSIEYASNSSTRMNYDEEYKMIIYDHLIKGSNPDFQGQMINMTDGSYEGYKLRKNGTWEHIEMVWHDKQSEPPTDKPGREDKKRSILGK